MSSVSYQIISVDGNIGSGKSTLLENMKAYFQAKTDRKIVFLQEPVEEWASIQDEEGTAILEKFYADQEKYSFPFQMMAYISRLALLKKAIKENPDAVIICERSVYTDRLVFAKMLFDSKRIELVNYTIYLKWFDTFVEECPVHKIIYVDSDPEVCFERIKIRSRTGESNIPLDYLTNCDKYHRDMITAANTCACLNINGNVDIFKNDEHLQQWMEQITEFICDGEKKTKTAGLFTE